ncbi:unnamed protein product [Bursaphelenchus okinawaensis]|uniref:Cytochrome b5 heme-binding domain-containing protein n=1 Tax=Bursaphelenchus okinawaensis TaxID=465554 RepID=A0A811JSY6_9BILA|nr:unnamed protein product [Bursaphelenchus okinawaensis]CAG9081102.1 unnamed protein product [Bursaphelenchus okinawaensis]
MSLGVPSTVKSETGRVKVALAPDRSLMAWVRLSESEDLASQKLMSVDDEELKQHNRIEDCWIVLFGMVYDVTRYLEFHPGGVDEIMQVAGGDGTRLFQEEHGWVNYQNMLKSCIVGPYRKSS